MDIQLTSDRVRVPASFTALNRQMYARGWTDGLPIVPPTEEAVGEMLQAVGRNPQDVVGVVPPRWAEATVEKIAINAVMAGCLPEYLAVVIGAVEAVTRPEFNLYGVQATTHPCATMIIVNGPIRHRLEINCGANAFGQGWRANATIGRALRLVLMNVGGGIPGRLDKATQGQPGKYTLCVGENEEESPWTPLHVDRGYPLEESTVTVIAVEAPHNINDHGSNDAQGILTTLVGSMDVLGINNAVAGEGELVVALGPEHAATIAADGLSKEDIKRYIWERARNPIEQFSPGNRMRLEGRIGDQPPGTLVPIAGEPDDIIVTVIGGPGKHSCWLSTFSALRSITVPIQLTPDS